MAETPPDTTQHTPILCKYKLKLYAAYELYANKAEPRFNSNAYENFGGNTQVYHSVRAGVGINF